MSSELTSGIPERNPRCRPARTLLSILAGSALAGALLAACSASSDQSAELATQAAATIQAQATERSGTEAAGTATAAAMPEASPTPLPSPVPPTALPTPILSPSPQPTAAACTLKAGGVVDLGVPDLVRLVEGQVFDKIWRITNEGTCTWAADYSLVFTGGEAMNGPDTVPLERDVAPGETIDLRLRLNAPSGIGIYSGQWMLQDEKGERFGIGEDGREPLIVRVDVISTEMAEKSGWKAEYFDNGNLNGLPVLTRTDAAVDFNWGSGSPAPGIPKDHFSVRWTSRREFEADSYHFRVKADDAIRLYVDNTLLIDSWHQSDIRWEGGTISLKEGKHTITMEYGERIGAARVYLTWEKQ
jgi:hypothetical protein